LTLVELVLSIAVSAVLMGAMTSAIVLASRAMPNEESPLTAASDGYYAAEQIADELFCTMSFTERSATVVEFTVADRNNDSNPETIRYAWSGTPGDPLTRKYNVNLPVDVVDDVREFALTYGLGTLSETHTETVTVWGAEQLLASFDGWSGITPTQKEQVVGGSNILSEYFQVTPPTGATQLKFTLAKVILRRGSIVPEFITVAIHRSLNDGSYKPAAAAIGTPAIIPGTSLTTSPLWIDALLSDVIVTDLTRTDYCLVVSGDDNSIGYAQYFYSTSAPVDAIYMRWSTDGGVTWSPTTSKLKQQDVRFYVYGASASQTTQPVVTQRYFVTSTGVTVRIGSDPSARVETSVQILNAPEVASP
jgi:hypothetical protein